MFDVLNYPRLLFVLSFILLWLATRVGALLRKGRKLDPDASDDFSTTLVTTLTLMGLIIGFSFSMAINRYEQRKNYEEAEANAIGTEFVRADLLPPEDAAKVRSLLLQYTNQRLAFYKSRGEQQIVQVDARTAQLESQLWAAVRSAAAAQPTPVMALAVAGMNDVLNSEGYTHAAWWNRIPEGAWVLMAVIAVISHLLVGYGARDSKAKGLLFAVLPFVVSVAFLLIADIDSPKTGMIHVRPQNLTRLVDSLHAN